MNLKTYQAYTMAEALAAVKRDLGPNAVILNTRSYARGGVLGVGKRMIIEVTATADAGRHKPSDAPSNAPRDEPIPASGPAASQAPGVLAARPPRTAALRAYGDRGVASPGERDERDAAATDLDKLKTRRLAQAMLEQHRRRKADVQATAEAATEASAAATLPPCETPETPSAPVARRFILKPTIAAAAPPVPPVPPVPSAPLAALPSPAPSSPPAPTRTPPIPAPPAAHEGDGMRDELSAIRQMVGEVLQRQVRKGGGPTPSLPQGLFDLYLKMIGQDLSDELADRVINEVREELAEDALDDDAEVRAAVCRSLAEYIPAADEEPPLESPDGRPLTLALVGPTGVGKTTTLAKLAASFKLRHRRKVGLITADTYRIAAVDQLRTYANIIGLPVRVVLTPGEMRQAVHALSDCDVILIDTAGRSQNDSGRLEELKQFIDAADPHEVHLVLSSTSGEKVLLNEAEAFGAVGVDKVVLTKLDEAVSFGVLVNVIRRIGKKLSFFTTGQEVPDHLEVGQPERLAELVLAGRLGGDVDEAAAAGVMAEEKSWSEGEAVPA